MGKELQTPVLEPVHREPHTCSHRQIGLMVLIKSLAQRQGLEDCTGALPFLLSFQFA